MRRTKRTRDAQDAVPKLFAQRRTVGVQPEAGRCGRVPVRQGRAAQVAVGCHGQAVQLHGRLRAGQGRAPAAAVPAAVAPAQADRVAQAGRGGVGGGIQSVRRDDDGCRLAGQQAAAPRAQAAVVAVQQQGCTTIVTPTRRGWRRQPRPRRDAIPIGRQLAIVAAHHGHVPDQRLRRPGQLAVSARSATPLVLHVRAAVQLLQELFTGDQPYSFYHNNNNIY